MEVNDEVYEVIKQINESNELNLEEMKNELYADKVFRKNGNLFFVKHIENATIIEETFNTQS